MENEMQLTFNPQQEGEQQLNRSEEIKTNKEELKDRLVGNDDLERLDQLSNRSNKTNKSNKSNKNSSKKSDDSLKLSAKDVSDKLSQVSSRQQKAQEYAEKYLEVEEVDIGPLPEWKLQQYRSQLTRIEYQLGREFNIYSCLIFLNIFMSFGSLIFAAVVALQDPFDVTLVPVMLWLMTVMSIFFALYDAKKRRINRIQKYSNFLISLVVFGNIGLLIFLVARIFDVAQVTTKLNQSSKLIIYVIFLAIYGFCEIIMLIILLPDATKCKRVLELRESLLKSLINNAILYNQ